MRAFSLILFVGLATACSKPPEAELLPEPLREVRFGSNSEQLRHVRQAVETTDCPDPYDAAGFACLRETKTVPGFDKTTYRFRDDKLEAVALAREAEPWGAEAFEKNLALVAARETLGTPDVAVEVFPAAVHFRARWSKERVEVRLQTMLVEGTILAGALGSDDALGPVHLTTLTLTAPDVPTEGLKGEASRLEDAEQKLDAFARWAQQRVDLLAAVRAGRMDDTTCPAIQRYVDVPLDVCGALVEASRDGRTTQAGRAALTDHIRGRGYQPFVGFMIAKHDDNLYEVTGMRPSWWGYVPAGGKHKLLRTTATSYESRGRFSLWVKKVESREITTVNGFKEEWDVLEEDHLGTLVKHVFEAPAGYETSDAARQLLAGLLRKSVE